MRKCRGLAIPSAAAFVQCLSLSVSAAAGLDDLHAALAKLRPGQPLRARVTAQSDKERKEDGKPISTRSRASLVADDGGPGKVLRLEYEDSLIAAAALEESSKQDNSTGPAAAMEELSAYSISRLLRAAEWLTDEIEGAQLTGEAPDTRHGRLLRRLELKLPPPKDGEKDLTVNSTARLWIDEAGVPVEFEILTHMEFRKFLLKARVDRRETSLFSVAAGRLVRAHLEKEDKTEASFSGSTVEHTLVTVEPLPPSPF